MRRYNLGNKINRAITGTAIILVAFCVGMLSATSLIGVDAVSMFTPTGSLKNDYVQASHAYERYGDENLSCHKGRGMSMAPAIFPGNTICLADYDPEIGAVEGDILVYRTNDSGLIGHAVISRSVRNDSIVYLTKGYNNRVEDPGMVLEDQIVGVVVEVRYT